MSTSSSSSQPTQPQIPPPPRAGDHPDVYTRDRVAQGLQYARKVRAYNDETRKLSGVSRLGIAAYEQACEKAMNTGWPLPTSLIKDIMYWEKEFWNRPSLWASSAGVEEDEQKMTTLGRLHILCRYGEWAGKFWEAFKLDVKKQKGVDFPWLITNRLVTDAQSALKLEAEHWRKFHARLQEEKDVWEEHGSEWGLDLVKTSWTVHQIAEKHDMTFADIKSLISLYADRNKQFHSPIADHVRNDKPDKLAKLIQKDYKWAFDNYPVEYRKERAALLFYIEMKSKYWFNRHPADTSGKWEPTDALKRDIARTRPKSKEERQKDGEARAKNALEEDDRALAGTLSDVLNDKDDLQRFVISRMFFDDANKLTRPLHEDGQKYINDIKRVYETTSADLKARNDTQRKLDRWRRELEKGETGLPGAKEQVNLLISKLDHLDQKIADAVPTDSAGQKDWYDQILAHKKDLGIKKSTLKETMAQAITLHCKIMWETERYYAQFGQDPNRPLSPVKQSPVKEQPRNKSLQQNRAGQSAQGSPSRSSGRGNGGSSRPDRMPAPPGVTRNDPCPPGYELRAGFTGPFYARIDDQQGGRGRGSGRSDGNQSTRSRPASSELEEATRSMNLEPRSSGGSQPPHKPYQGQR